MLGTEVDLDAGIDAAKLLRDVEELVAERWRGEPGGPRRRVQPEDGVPGLGGRERGRRSNVSWVETRVLESKERSLLETLRQTLPRLRWSFFDFF